ncbi:MAG TPA: right-handed parallel beta-helix repeat-containing protein [Thermoanaerobaculia bacterium]|nr:right-handed parallel beta-helix repeat-containing protein [Thermoanaerobaculia bacterium]
MRTLAAGVFSLLFSFPLFGAAVLHVDTDHLSSVDPGTPVARTIRIFNLGPDVAENVTLTIDLPTGVRFDIQQTNGWSCAETSPGIVCTIASLPVDQTVGSSINGAFVFDPSLGGQHILVRMDVTASNGTARSPWFVSTVVRQLYRVTSTSDSGAGSLRDALTSANTTCLRECRIDFDLPAGSVIEPLTPLPAITACARIDFGSGPIISKGDRTIELSGARLTSGHGLVYRPACPGAQGSSPLLWIRGVAINRFPWNGIHIQEGHIICSGCFIGTDITGRQARPNAGRGISVDSRFSFVRVEDSVLSGNGRSGVFAWEATEVRVIRSFVGTTPDGLPLPNGASGLFMNKGVLIATESTIANNREFGIGVHGGATLLAFANTMTANGGQPIDWGLDGRTEQLGNMPDVPELLSASYDPATRRTTITGRVTITRPGAYRHALELQADGKGTSTITNLTFRTPVGLHEFTIVHEGDLRGRVVTVTNSRGYDEQDWALRETSEVSNGITVQ